MHAPFAHWDAFKKSVDELNDFVRPFVLRRYQSALLNMGTVSVVSPISGLRVEVRSSVMLDRGRIAYPVDGPIRVWLITGEVRRGFPLHELIREDDGSVHPIVDPWFKKWSPMHPVNLGRLKITPICVSHEKTAPTATLVVGNSNFAHHLWNELPALDEWLGSVSDDQLQSISICATAEPLGPICKLFPRLSSCRIIEPNLEAQKQHLQTATLVTRVGAARVTTGIRKKVIERTRAMREGRVPRRLWGLLASGRPSVWISVRLGSRTAENQEDYILAVIQRLFAVCPRSVVLLNGFSFPVHFFDDPRTLRQRGPFQKRALETITYVQRLCGLVFERMGSEISARVWDISGLELAEAIQLGTFCDYYVCHAGTLQHMIAWIHNIPGLIHMPQSNQHHASWHGTQLEDGVIPAHLPREFIAPTGPPLGRAAPDRNYNYRFVNIDEAAERTVNCLLAALEARESMVPPDTLADVTISSEGSPAVRKLS